MPAEPFHPLVVHLPIALAVVMPLLAFAILLAWWLDALPQRTWLIVVGLQLVLVGSGFVALRTGETDEHHVEHVVAKATIHVHEEAAERFVAISGVVLAIGVVAVAIRNQRIARALATATLIGSLVVLYLGYRTGHSGGRLVYRDGAANAYIRGAAAPVSPPLDEDAHQTP